MTVEATVTTGSDSSCYTSLQLLGDSLMLGLTTLPRPVCPDEGALLKMRACGFCGSDLDKIRHPKPGAILGHELVGELVALGPLAKAKTGLSVGQRVVVAHHVPCGACHYCRHQSPSMCRQFKATNIPPGGFSQWVPLSAAHLEHTMFALPDSLPDDVGTVTEPLACVLRAVERLQLKPNSTVALIGLGFMGLLSAMVLSSQGADVVGLDLNPERNALAVSQGWVVNAMSERTAYEHALRCQTQDRGADVVFLTVVTSETLADAMRWVRDGGTVMLFAGSGGQPPVLDHDAIYHRELTVMSSYSPSLEHLKQALEALALGSFHVSPLLTHRVVLGDVLDALPLYQSGQAIKVVVTS